MNIWTHEQQLGNGEALAQKDVDQVRQKLLTYQRHQQEQAADKIDQPAHKIKDQQTGPKTILDYFKTFVAHIGAEQADESLSDGSTGQRGVEAERTDESLHGAKGHSSPLSVPRRASLRRASPRRASPRRASPRREVLRSVRTAVQTEVKTSKLGSFKQKFKRVRLLGRGSFGEVYRCQSNADGREYAIKVIRYKAGGAQGATTEQQVLREAQTLALMSHTNVLRFYSAWIEKEEAHSDGGGESCSSIGTYTPKQMTPLFAPPPSPALHPKDPPHLLLGEGFDATGGSQFSYDEGSCGSGVVFFEWNEEEVASEEMAARARAASELDDSPPEGHAGFCRSVSVGAGPENSFPHDTFPVRATSLEPVHRRQRPSILHEDFDFCKEHTATLYIQVELCRQDTLQAWIANRNAALGVRARHLNSQPWLRKALSIFLQCVRALEHLHSRCCVHRDVKPANILFARKDGAVRLADFGLAKVLSEQAEDDTVTDLSPSPLPRPPGGRGSRGSVGTPSYASPEQLSGGPLSSATDVYSLGLVLAELVCPVQTLMERAAVLEGFRAGRVPDALKEEFPTLANLAIRMTDMKPTNRPSVLDILGDAQKVLSEVVAAQAPSKSADAAAGSRTSPPSSPPRKAIAPSSPDDAKFGSNRSRKSVVPHSPPGATTVGHWLFRRRPQHQALRASRNFGGQRIGRRTGAADARFLGASCSGSSNRPGSSGALS